MQQENQVQPFSVETIKTKIHDIRGQRVMLDRDLAELYQVETKQLNRQVKRNIERFPEDFMFQLNDDEHKILRCQFGTSKSGQGGTRYLPYAFTELGIAMLSSVLSSKIAIQVNISIMRAFVSLRQAYTFTQNQDLRFEKFEHRLDNLSNYVEDILQTQNDINDDTATQLELINQTLAELQTHQISQEEFEKRKPIGFKIKE